MRPAGTGAGAPGVTAATPRRVLAPALRLRALLAGRERGWEVRPRCAAEVANIGTCRSGRPRHCCHPGVVLPATGWKTEISLLPLPPSPPPLRTPPTQPHPNPSEGAASASPSPRRRFPAAPRAPAGPLPPHTHTPPRVGAPAARPPTQHCPYQPADSARRTRSGRVTSGIGGGGAEAGFLFYDLYSDAVPAPLSADPRARLSAAPPSGPRPVPSTLVPRCPRGRVTGFLITWLHVANVLPEGDCV